MPAQALKEKSDIDIVRIETAKHGQIYADMLTLALRTGLRNGDIRCLNWDSVDFKNQTMNVVEGKYTKSKLTKTKKSFKDKASTLIINCGGLTAVLKKDETFLSQLRAEYKKALLESPQKIRKIYLDETCTAILKRRFLKWGALSKYVFTSRDSSSNNKRVDSHISRSACSQVASKVKEALNESRSQKGLRAVSYSLHSTRKTAGYLLFSATNNIEVVAEFLKHESSTTTRRYIGLDDDENQRSFDILSQALS